MKKTFAFGAAASQGAWPVQEDGFFADPLGGIFAVADGFGGRGAGDLAAKAALLEVRAQGAKAERGFPDLFSDAHRAIAARNQPRAPAARGGCSLAVASVTAAQAELFQCGTCSILLAREGRLRPLLLPQASPREDFQPLWPDQALGVGEGGRPERRIFSGRAGDLLLLASSGVDWELESFGADLFSRLAGRAAGEDLSGVARGLLENGGAAAQGWNGTLVLVELLWA